MKHILGKDEVSGSIPDISSIANPHSYVLCGFFGAFLHRARICCFTP